ncbi:fimbrial protein [Escherichia coli]|uniref:fimbrial protein n=1 Tax=Escherichia coli TaxID=562 RepID=UPI0012FF7829|nr:spore coat protein U domain-containing protein [Escherichia coli]
MNKKSLVAHVVAGILLLGGSTAAMAAANPVGTHTQNMSLNVTTGTCNVTWPTDVSFAVNSADVDNASLNGTIGEIKNTGNIELTGCPPQTRMKYTVQADIPVGTGDPWKGLFRDGSTSIAYSLSNSEDFTHSWILDGSEKNLGTTDDNGALTVPVWAKLIKRSDDAVTPGNFQAAVTYTVSYD